MRSNSLLKLSLLSLFIIFSLQNCVHDELSDDLVIMDHEEVDDVRPPAGKRFLQTAATTGPLRIHADYTYLSGDATYVDYIKNKLMPAAISYWSKALTVNQLGVLKVSSAYPTVCNLNVPSYLYEPGVNADLLIFVTGRSDEGDWVSAAQPCSIIAGGRPVHGLVEFNYRLLTLGNSYAFENSLVIAMHEINHVLGFSLKLFPYFPNPLSFVSITIGGVTTAYINIEPLTTRLRNHFGCQTIQGALLEQQGQAGTVGSHFERRIFNNEFMTANSIGDMRISEFSLALLQGTGWYGVNYAYAEPHFFGKGQGCGFYNGPCASAAGANYKGYCSNFGAYDCTFNRKQGAYCGHLYTTYDPSLPAGWNYWGNNKVVYDPWTDNCPVQSPLNGVNCEDPLAVSRRIISGESYGVGSKCFMGTIYPTTSGLKVKNQYCLKYTCTLKSPGVYNLVVTVGTKTATCVSGASVSVTGYGGKLDCPNVNDFCSTVGAQYCKRNCLGRGTCVNGFCKCNTGFTGDDCGMTV